MKTKTIKISTEFFMFLKNDVLEPNISFVLSTETSPLTVIKGSKKEKHFNTNGNDILFLRLKMLHKLYEKNSSNAVSYKRLVKHLKKTPFFIGLIPAKRFEKVGALSCYAFDYTLIKQYGFSFLVAI